MKSHPMMSTSVSTGNLTANQSSPTADSSRARGTPSPWTWMTLACILLGASGGVRAWQDLRFHTVAERVEASPFPLKDLPATLGDDWRAQEGGESRLDPEVARIAGCTDSLVRTYRNATTGVSLTALILFGPGRAVVGHIPEVCYPAAGYRMVGMPSTCAIPLGSLPAAEFRTLVYARERDRRSWHNEVYYTFRHGDRWAPDAQRYWKDFRHHPSMFKVQVQRQVSDSERREVNNPTEQFLALLIPEIEGRLAAAPRGIAAPAAREDHQEAAEDEQGLRDRRPVLPGKVGS